MDKFNGFNNSWILSEDGLLKTDLVVKNGIIESIGKDYTFFDKSPQLMI